VPLLVLLALVAGVWVRLWVGDPTLVVRDAGGYFYPMKTLLVETIRGGEIPWWNPWLRNGLPFYANPEVGLVYPPTLLFLLVPSITLAFNWTVIAHFAIAAAGFHMWLREQGRSPAAAAFGAGAIVLGGFAVTLANYLNFLQAFAWIGWTWWAWLRWLDRGSPRWLALVAVGFSLQFLGGEPQVPVLAAAVAVVMTWAGPASGAGRRRARRAAGGLALAAVGSAALAAVQLVPTVELFLQSGRRGGLALGETLGWSLHPLQATGLVVPPYFDGPGGGFDFHRLPVARLPWLYSAYLGLPVVALAAAGASPNRTRFSVTWGVVAVLGLFFALGEHNPLVPPLMELPVGLRLFRYPEKMVLLTAIAVPVLAARGVDALRGEEAFAAVRALLACGLVVIAGAVAPALLEDPVREIVSRREGVPEAALDPRWVLEALERGRLHVAAIGAAVAVALLARRRLGGSALVATLGVVAVVDLATVNPGAAPLGPAEWIGAEPDVVEDLPRKEIGPSFRVRTTPVVGDPHLVFVRTGATSFEQQRFLFRTMSPNRAMIHRVPAEDGTEAFRPVHDDWRSEILGQLPVDLRIRYLRLASTAYFLERPGALDGVAGVEVERSTVRGLEWHAIEDPLPRAYLVRRAVVEPDSVAGVNRLVAGGEDPRRVAYVDRGPGLEGPAERVEGAVRWLESGNHTVTLATSRPDSTLLVLTDTAYPGWTATVDGRRVPIVRANWHFRGVYLPPGDHVVRFDYRPRGVVPAAGVSFVTLVLLILVVARGTGRGKDLP